MCPILLRSSRGLATVLSLMPSWRDLLELSCWPCLPDWEEYPREWYLSWCRQKLRDWILQNMPKRGVAPTGRRVQWNNSILYLMSMFCYDSGGNKRKLSTAIALVGDTPIVLLVSVSAHSSLVWLLGHSNAVTLCVCFSGWAHHRNGPNHEKTFMGCTDQVGKERKVHCAHFSQVSEEPCRRSTLEHVFQLVLPHLNSVWRSVRPCVPDWLSWWMDSSSVLGASNTLRASELALYVHSIGKTLSNGTKDWIENHYKRQNLSVYLRIYLFLILGLERVWP